MPSTGQVGCTVGYEDIVVGALLAHYDEPLVNTEVKSGFDQESQVADSVGDE